MQWFKKNKWLLPFSIGMMMIQYHTSFWVGIGVILVIVGMVMGDEEDLYDDW